MSWHTVDGQEMAAVIIARQEGVGLRNQVVSTG